MIQTLMFGNHLTNFHTLFVNHDVNVRNSIGTDTLKTFSTKEMRPSGWISSGSVCVISGKYPNTTPQVARPTAFPFFWTMNFR